MQTLNIPAKCNAIIVHYATGKTARILRKDIFALNNIHTKIDKFVYGTIKSKKDVYDWKSFKKISEQKIRSSYGC